MAIYEGKDWGIESKLFLEALNESWVDNWSWYNDAIDLYEEWVGE